MKLFEIEFTKDYGCNTEMSNKVRRHQIPADGQWNACALLGQIFNGDFNEDYDLNIISVKEVK